MRSVWSSGASVPAAMTTDAAGPAVPGDFATDSAVHVLDDGRYGADFTGAWAVPRGAHGGFIAAITVRAMEAALPAEIGPLRSLSCHFLRPAGIGAVEVEVTLERQGRVASSVTARVTQDGAVVLLALAAFGHSFGGDLDYSLGPPPPDLPLPDGPLPRFVRPEGVWVPPFIEQLAFTSDLESRTDGVTSGGWLRLATPAIPDAAAMVFYADAWLPTPFLPAARPAMAPTIDYTVHLRRQLPLAGMDEHAPLLVRFRTEETVDGYFTEDGQLWAPDGTLLAEVRQMGCLLPFAAPAA